MNNTFTKQQMDENDDIDLGHMVMGFYEQAHDEGLQEGYKIGSEENKKKSEVEGKKYGIHIGNEFNYYLTVIATYDLCPNITPSTNVDKVQQLKEKIVHSVNILKPNRIYEPGFDEEYQKLKANFKKYLNLMKVKSFTDNATNLMEF